MNKLRGNMKRTNLVKGETGDMLAHHHSIPSKWKNHLSVTECTLRVDTAVKYIHTYIHTTEPRASQVEMATEKLKCYKSPGTDPTPPH
jgi:hypothetical protein